MESKTVLFTRELAQKMLDDHQNWLDEHFDNEWDRIEFQKRLDDIGRPKEDWSSDNES